MFSMYLGSHVQHVPSATGTAPTCQPYHLSSRRCHLLEEFPIGRKVVALGNSNPQWVPPLIRVTSRPEVVKVEIQGPY